jgi:hypothetical protein
MRPLATLAALVLCACGGGAAPSPAVVLAPVVHGSSSSATARNDSAPPPPALAKPPGADRPLAPAFHDALVASFPDSGDPAVPVFQRAVKDEQSGDRPMARKGYYEVIMKSPQSPLVPLAYLGFGEMFFEEADAGASDRWNLAQQAYEKVVAFPPPKNLAYAYAWHRLGLVFARTGDTKSAAAAQQRALEACDLFPGLPLSDEVAAAARSAGQ